MEPNFQSSVGQQTAPPPSEAPRVNIHLKTDLVPERSPPKTQLFEDAKKLLTEKRYVSGGQAEENVNEAIKLLNQHLSSSNAPSNEEASRLMEHAKIVLSDEKVVEFLISLNDNQIEQIASDDNYIFLAQSELEGLSPGFGDNFDKTDESVYFCGDKYSSSMNTTFYIRLKKNVVPAIEYIRSEHKRIQEERIASREENPKLTTPIFDIEEAPNSFSGRCVYLDRFNLSGSITKKAENDYRLTITDTREKTYFSRGYSKNEIIFSTSKIIATQIQSTIKENETVKVKLYCDLYVTNQGGPWAQVYKIDFYNIFNEVIRTITE